MIFEKSDDGPRRDFPPRKMVQGNWKCSDCGKEITELPFEPSPDRPIYCRDCWGGKRAKIQPLIQEEKSPPPKRGAFVFSNNL